MKKKPEPKRCVWFGPLNTKADAEAARTGTQVVYTVRSAERDGPLGWVVCEPIDVAAAELAIQAQNPKKDFWTLDET